MAYLSWFKFTPSDWIMGKIQRTSEITQARFMRLICLYWNKQCVLSYEDAEIEIDKEHIDILLSKKIIKVENDFLVIEFLNEQMGTISETSQKRKEAVLQRWAKVKQKDTSVLNKDTSVLQSDTDKIREDKIREDKIRKENIINNTVFVSECKNSSQWLEVTAMQNKINIDTVKLFIDTFESHLIIMEEQKKTVKEYKEHFTHWFKKQDLSNFRIKQFGKTNQI
jgi:hypothetical protein